MEASGKKLWVIPGGNIPLQSNGKEPEMVSQDRIAVLNTGMNDVKIKLTIYHDGQDPVTDYNIEIKGRRLKKIRINDLIDPSPLMLESEYAIVIEAQEAVVVQFTRMNTGHKYAAIMGTMAFGTDN
jgi:hypothetical protein